MASTTTPRFVFLGRALHPSELDYSLEPRCVRATEQITPFAVQGSSQCFAQPSPILRAQLSCDDEEPLLRFCSFSSRSLRFLLDMRLS
jgi:hypothetical protein